MYSALAHYFIGMGLSISIPKGLRINKWLSTPCVVLLALVWEYGLQRLIAAALPWWDPSPNPYQILEWTAGAASGLLLLLVIERKNWR